MPTSALQAQIDAATAYEEFFVPALFQEWAPRVVVAAQLQPGQRALDVACGTGVLAREAAARVGAAGTVVGLDPNPGMLTVAKRRAPDVEWREGTAECRSAFETFTFVTIEANAPRFLQPRLENNSKVT
jgi:ubiquinone/menaquinone biosynthesis C-methylase UbiE